MLNAIPNTSIMVKLRRSSCLYPSLARELSASSKTSGVDQRTEKLGIRFIGHQLSGGDIRSRYLAGRFLQIGLVPWGCGTICRRCHHHNWLQWTEQWLSRLISKVYQAEKGSLRLNIHLLAPQLSDMASCHRTITIKHPASCAADSLDLFSLYRQLGTITDKSCIVAARVRRGGRAQTKTNSWPVTCRHDNETKRKERKIAWKSSSG